MAIVHLLVEGEIDEAVARRLVSEAGHTAGVCYGKKGISYIRSKIGGFNASAVAMPYLALVDFADTGCPCPGDVVSSLVPYRNPKMLFRVVVREIESWLLADQSGLAKFLQVTKDRLPVDPENEFDPKQTLVNIARHSRSNSVRSSIVPMQGSTAKVGQLYNADLVRFVAELWNIQNAGELSPSLRKCMARLRNLI